MPERLGKPQCVVKVVLLGDGGVGKSCLMTRYVCNRFEENSFHTLGVELLNKDIAVKNSVFTLQIWDTAGQERFKSLRTPFYRGADICLLTFALDERQSFENLSNWIREFVAYGDIKNSNDYPFVIVANKYDLPQDQWEVTETEIKEWCQARGNLPYVLTSAKDAVNVEEAFTMAVERWAAREEQLDKQFEANGGIQLTSATICLIHVMSRCFLHSLKCPSKFLLKNRFAAMLDKTVQHFSSPAASSLVPEITPLFLNPNDKHSIYKAAELILAEQVIAVPTDTIYGVAALAQSPLAVRRIYEVKGRHEDKPLAICVGHGEDVGKYCRVTVDAAVLEELYPGPVTLIFPRLPILNPELNPGTTTVGVRVPDSDFILKLARAVGQPLALTSANLSGQTSALNCEEFKALWSTLGAIVDAGSLASTRAGSTVVDLSKVDESGRCTRYRVVRDGCALKDTCGVLEKFGLKEDG